jgi:hypothetical protein
VKSWIIILWTLVGICLNQQPLFAEESVPVQAVTPAFSATTGTNQTAPVFSQTEATSLTAPVLATTPALNGTAVLSFSPTSAITSTLTPTAGLSTTSAAKTTIPPLESFPLKPQEWEKWSVGILVGLYHPSLDLLNRILSDNNVGILQDPNFLLPGNPAFPTTQRNIVTPHIFGLAEYGVEAQLEINPKYSFTFAFSSWQGESRAEDSATIFTRSDQPPSIVPRDARYHVTINQFWWGIRYHFLNDPGRKKLYINLGLLGISGAYLTMDSLERVITNNKLSFDSVSVTEASGFGYTSRFGAGGEYYVKKWLSLGVNANYVIGKINELKVTRYFASGFAEPPPVPADSLPPDPTVPIPQPVNLPAPGDTITYAPMATNGAADYIGNPQPLSLDLNGFDLSFYIQFHF